MHWVQVSCLLCGMTRCVSGGEVWGGVVLVPSVRSKSSDFRDRLLFQGNVLAMSFQFGVALEPCA
jgi:hypothetical protein